MQQLGKKRALTWLCKPRGSEATSCACGRTCRTEFTVQDLPYRLRESYRLLQCRNMIKALDLKHVK